MPLHPVLGREVEGGAGSLEALKPIGLDSTDFPRDAKLMYSNTPDQILGLGTGASTDD